VRPASLAASVEASSGNASFVSTVQPCDPVPNASPSTNVAPAISAAARGAADRGVKGVGGCKTDDLTF
jgi:hypothetical protein